MVTTYAAKQNKMILPELFYWDSFSLCSLMILCGGHVFLSLSTFDILLS